ncbi:phosphatidylserine decarboxylase [Candidatus Woesearchaeota archaeon]|nr:phosphatidylserine decarboxylase [Candidatus Woesearchaeota archaeon]
MQTIYYIDRKTKKILIENPPKEKALRAIYERTLGRLTIRHLTENTIISKITGTFFRTPLSKQLIKKFTDEYNINTKEFIKHDFKSFNDFFIRKIDLKYRKINQKNNTIISPADGKILGFQRISETDTFNIKGQEFNLIKFLNNKKLANKFHNASMFIIRLSMPDYHRFHFPLDGIALKSKRVRGNLASVSPIATHIIPKIFWKNKRQYTIIENEKIKEIIMAEIGASNVGSIKQTFLKNSKVNKGDEKGYFSLGGSAIALIFPENTIKIDKDILENTKNKLETKIFIGERIASY